LVSSESSVSSSIAYGRRVLNLSPKEALQINSVKMKSKEMFAHRGTGYF
jgi:hypothetical protein